MKKKNFQETILFGLLLCSMFYSCGNHTSDSGDTLSSTPSINNSIAKMDSKNAPLLVGLWKLYKIEYAEESAVITKENIYLNIQSNHTFESNNHKGSWLLTYGNIDSTYKVLLLFKRELGYDSNKSDLMTKVVTFKKENNTEFLILE